MKSDEVYAAIAMALYEFQHENAHDCESGLITIRPKDSEWNSHTLKMTQWP